MKFVHAADLHLDSPLRGLERYEGAPVERMRGATRRAFENLIDLCLAEDVAFLLLAGDIFDGDWKDYGTGLFFIAQLARLGQAGIPTYLVRGNHDAASQITKYLPLPAHVHELGSRQAETKVLEMPGGAVAIHGQSFATRAVTDDLAVDYPLPVRGLVQYRPAAHLRGGQGGSRALRPLFLGRVDGQGVRLLGAGARACPRGAGARSLDRFSWKPAGAARRGNGPERGHSGGGRGRTRHGGGGARPGRGALGAL